MSTLSERAQYDESARRTSWAVTGAYFGGFMMIMIGALHVLQGISSLRQDKILVLGTRYVYALNVQTWGWIHLAMGVIAVIVGITIFRRARWAMIAGVVVAGVSTLLNFMFIPYYSIWSMILIGLNVFVIWSLCTTLAHLDEL
jgi:hypothetical protein